MFFGQVNANEWWSVFVVFTHRRSPYDTQITVSPRHVADNGCMQVEKIFCILNEQDKVLSFSTTKFQSWVRAWEQGWAQHWVQSWVQSWVQGWVQGLPTAVFKVVPSVQLVRFTGWQTALCSTSPLFPPSPLVLPQQFLLYLLISLPLLPLFFSNSLRTFPHILPIYFSSLVSLSSESPLVWHFSRLRGRESATPP